MENQQLTEEYLKNLLIYPFPDMNIKLEVSQLLKNHKYILGVLTRGQQIVCDLYFGVSNNGDMSLAEVSKILHESRQSVSNTLSTSMEAIKKSVALKLISLFTDRDFGCTIVNYKTFSKELLEETYDNYLKEQKEKEKINYIMSEGEDMVETKTREWDFEQLMNLKVEDMDLSVRAYNCLRYGGISTMEEIISYTPQRLKRVRNVGVRAYEEIVNMLHSHGLDLCPEGVLVPTWRKTMKEKYLNQNKATQKTYEEPAKTAGELDINELPEKYREIYALGAGVKAKKEMDNQGTMNVLRSRVLQKTNKISYNSNKVQYINVEPTRAKGLQSVLQGIKQDVALIYDMDSQFVLENKDMLIQFVLESDNVSINERVKIVKYLMSVTIDEPVHE